MNISIQIFRLGHVSWQSQPTKFFKVHIDEHEITIKKFPKKLKVENFI